METFATEPHLDEPVARPMNVARSFVVLLCMAGAFVLMSFFLARSHARSLAAQGRLIPLGGSLSLYRIDTQQFAPAWQFRFDPPDEFAVGPAVIEVGFTGGVVATNPLNLLQKLSSSSSNPVPP